jgi:hypothetical protein
MPMPRLLWLAICLAACETAVAQPIDHRPAAAIDWGSVFAPRPQAVSSQPHPAVARITVHERDGIAYGSGTLVDVADEHGLVVTNWHVVCDAAGDIEVQFPDGFRSKAKVLKTDQTWDLAALVIWKPLASPAPLSAQPPRPGEPLTIAGYGSGDFRAATARCTQYVSPGERQPFEMVEVGAQARQGDSGGPILNQRGELAGVLFGAARGTTSGSHVGRVRTFLATVSPRLVDPAMTPYSASGNEQIASTNPFATPTGEILSTQVAMTDSTATNPPPVANAAAPAATAMVPVPARDIHSSELDPRPPVTRTASGRATQITLGSLPDRPGATSETGEEMSKAESLLPLWSRPLPENPAPVEPAESPVAASNEFWSRLIGEHPIDQGKSLLALLAIVGIAARFVRSS